MLYILLHKDTNGTHVELITRSKIKAVQELVRQYADSAVHELIFRYNENQQNNLNAQIEDFDMTDGSTFYAEIVMEDEETEWWEVIPYKEADVE